MRGGAGADNHPHAPSPQDAGGLRAPGGGGGHDDHGQEARPQVRLHLCAVALQPPAAPRAAPARQECLDSPPAPPARRKLLPPSRHAPRPPLPCLSRHPASQTHSVLINYWFSTTLTPLPLFGGLNGKQFCNVCPGLPSESQEVGYRVVLERGTPILHLPAARKEASLI